MRPEVAFPHAVSFGAAAPQHGSFHHGAALAGYGVSGPSANLVSMGPQAAVGQAVQARRGGGPHWLPGHILRVQGGTCAVRYEDGSVEDCVPWAYVQMLAPRQAPISRVPSFRISAVPVALHAMLPAGPNSGTPPAPAALAAAKAPSPAAQGSPAQLPQGLSPTPHSPGQAQSPQGAVALTPPKAEARSPQAVASPVVPEAPPPPDEPEPHLAGEPGSESGEESDSSCGSQCDQGRRSSWWKPSSWINPLTGSSPSSLLNNVKSTLSSMVENLSEVQVDVDLSPQKPRKPPLALSSLSNEYSEEAVRAATKNFDKESLLGSGACGSVYKGAMEDGTEVAVKVLNFHDFSGFEDEVRVLSRFRHPNLVILMGFARHTDTGARSLVYEYLSGGDLSGQLRQSRKGTRDFRAAQRVAVALDAASGLSHLHNARPRAFHRDIKSANILLDRNGTAKMADFGLARVSPSAQHRVSAASGTPGYACPEYLRTGIVTEGSESHSFGMVLLELLTGVPPAVVHPEKPDKLVFPFEHLKGSADKALDMVDSTAGWTEPLARTVAELAFCCIDPKPEMRPRFSQLVEILRWMKGPDSEVNPASLKRMLDLVAPSWPRPLEEQAKAEGFEEPAEYGRLLCVRAEGADLAAMGEELLSVPLPRCGEEVIVGRSCQSADFWSALALEERLRGMISREHFKVVGAAEGSPAAAAFSVACLSPNGVVLNSETLRRDAGPRKLQHGDILSFVDVSDPGGEQKPFLAFQVQLHEQLHGSSSEEPSPAPPSDALAFLELCGPNVDMSLAREARQLFLCGDESSVSSVHLRIGREHQRSFWRRVLRPEHHLGGSWAFMAPEHFEVVAQPPAVSRLRGGDAAGECGWRFRVRILALGGVTINHSVVCTCGDEQELKPGDVLTVEAVEPGTEPEGPPQRGLHFAFALAKEALPRPPCGTQAVGRTTSAQEPPAREQQAVASRPEPEPARGERTEAEPPGVVEWSRVSIPALRPSAPSLPTGWEVLVDAGWTPWAPGVPFEGRAGEEVGYTLGNFSYKATFSSCNDGIQVNALTKKERPLRRVVPPQPLGAGELVAEADLTAPISQEKAGIISRMLQRGLAASQVAAIAEVPEEHVSALASQPETASSGTSLASANLPVGLKSRAAGVLMVPVDVVHEEYQ